MNQPASAGFSRHPKTLCGKAHFEGALDVSYKVVTKAAELP